MNEVSDRGWFSRCLTGGVPLVEVVWIGYVLPTAIGSLFLRTFIEVGSPGLTFVLFLISLAYSLWINVSLWRCAPNAKYRISTLAARAWSVIGLLATLAAVLNVIR